MIQRSLMRSYDTTGSPSFSVWHLPANPDHNVLIATGPNSGVPDLENTAKSVLTTSTTGFGPTAAWVPGGAELTTSVPWGREKPWPIPAKLTWVAGASDAG